jgi:EAL domain-containing protein (putative c-di-GMP-specific phosphodiesterase class I)
MRAQARHGIVDLVLIDLVHALPWSAAVRAGDAARMLDAAAERLASLLEASEEMHVLVGPRLALLRHAELDRTDARCQRLRVELSLPIGPLGGRLFAPDPAFGAARIESGTAPSAALLRAEAALRVARDEGAGRLVWHRAVVDDYLRLRGRLAQDLPAALAGPQIVLYLQPVLCLRTESVVAGLSQLRWQHPRLGITGSAELAALAREAGRRAELERRLVPLALQHLAACRQAGPALPLTLELSTAAITAPYFPERLRDACAAASVATSLLELEIRESDSAAHDGLLRQRLRELQEIGAQIVLGDVERSRLPLADLLGLQLAALKCSMRWVREQLSEPRARAALGALVRVGHSLGGHVIASGADTAQDLELLRELRFDQALGASCGPPLPAAEFQASARAANARASRIDPTSI